MDQRVPLFDWPEKGVRRTPYLIYSDPDVYEAEMQRIFRGRTWHYLGLEIEIPNEGDYRLMDVGDTSIILVRTPNVCFRSNIRHTLVRVGLRHWCPVKSHSSPRHGRRRPTIHVFLLFSAFLLRQENKRSWMVGRSLSLGRLTAGPGGRP